MTYQQWQLLLRFMILVIRYMTTDDGRGNPQRERFIKDCETDLGAPYVEPAPEPERTPWQE